MQPKLYTILFWNTEIPTLPYWDMCYNGRYPVCTAVLEEAENRLKELQADWPDEIYKIFEMKELE